MRSTRLARGDDVVRQRRSTGEPASPMTGAGDRRRQRLGAARGAVDADACAPRRYVAGGERAEQGERGRRGPGDVVDAQVVPGSTSISAGAAHPDDVADRRRPRRGRPAARRRRRRARRPRSGCRRARRGTSARRAPLTPGHLDDPVAGRRRRRGPPPRPAVRSTTQTRSAKSQAGREQVGAADDDLGLDRAARRRAGASARSATSSCRRRGDPGGPGAVEVGRGRADRHVGRCRTARGPARARCRRGAASTLVAHARRGRSRGRARWGRSGRPRRRRSARRRRAPARPRRRA